MGSDDWKHENPNLQVIYYEEIIRETEKAWLIDFGDNKQLWVPKSMCSLGPERCEIMIPEWLAYKEGLI